MAKPITDLVALGVEIRKEVAEKFDNNVKLAMAYCHATDEKNLTESGVMCLLLITILTTRRSIVIGWTM